MLWWFCLNVSDLAFFHYGESCIRLKKFFDVLHKVLRK